MFIEAQLKNQIDYINFAVHMHVELLFQTSWDINLRISSSFCLPFSTLPLFALFIGTSCLPSFLPFSDKNTKYILDANSSVQYSQVLI